MTQYTYAFYTLRNEIVIAEVPLYGVFVTNQINGPGQMTGTFQLNEIGIRNSDLVQATVPGQTAVAIERNGIVVWTGIVWSRVYQSQSKSFELFCWGFEAYPSRARILTDVTYLSLQNRLNVFRKLWLDMQSVTGRNLNINVPPTYANTYNQMADNLTVLATDRKFYSEIMSQLSDAASGGFDWTIDVTRVGSNYVKNLRLGWPSFGTTSSPSSLVFEYPGNILNYYQTESMADAGTHVSALGSGQSDSMLVANGDNGGDVMVTQGWPRWDVDVSRKDVAVQSDLNGIAAQEALVRRPPMASIRATVKAMELT